MGGFALGADLYSEMNLNKRKLSSALFLLSASSTFSHFTFLGASLKTNKLTSGHIFHTGFPYLSITLIYLNLDFYDIARK